MELQLAAISKEVSELRNAERAPMAETGQGVMPSPTPPDILAGAHYLPSRSWAGGKLHYGGPELKIVTHGFVDLEYADAGPDGSRNGVAGFDSHHANLFFDANLRSNLVGHVELELERSGDTIEIDQAYLRWAVTDGMALDVGRFYTPFGMERFTWYSPTNMLVSRPIAYRVIVPREFLRQRHQGVRSDPAQEPAFFLL